MKREVPSPPECPSCHRTDCVTLEADRDSERETTIKVWRCSACEVRWEVRLTPRAER